MASIAYWIIGIVVVGMVMGLVNYTFTPRSDSSFPKHMTYQELLQSEAEMFITVPTQHDGSLQASGIADVVDVLDSVEISSAELQTDYSVSEIPLDMEGSIFELFVALGATAVEATQEDSSDVSAESSEGPDVKLDIPGWVLAAEIEASEEKYPVESIEATEAPNAVGDVPPALEYELAGLEPPVSDMEIPEGYEEISLRMEDLQEAVGLSNSLSGTFKKSNGNVIPFPDVMDSFNVLDQAPYHIPFADYSYIRQLYGDLADRVTTTPALGPRFAEDVMIGTVMEECGTVYLEFRGSKIPVSKNARSFKGETVFVTGQFVSDQKFLASRLQLAQEAAKARQAV